MRTLRNLALLFAATLALASAALLLAAAVPNGPIAANLRDAGAALSQNYWASPLTGGKVDVYTDCVAMSAGLAAGESEGLWHRAVRSSVIGHCPALADWLGGHPTGAVDYFRYWNGYTALTRPMLATLGYGPLRALTTGALLALLAALLVTTGRTLGWRLAACLAAALLFVGIDVAAVTVIHSIAWSLAAAGGLWVLRTAPERVWRPEPWFFLGAATTFLELLNNALVTLTLPLALALLRAQREPGAGPVPLRGLALAAGGWALGEFGFWAAKFGLSILTLGPGAWDAIGGKALEKLSGTTALGEATPLLAISLNLQQLTQPGWRLACVLGVAALLAWRIVRRRRGPEGLHLAAWIAVSAAPFAWYAAFANHSIVHAWFTCRLLAPTLLLLLAVATQPGEAEG